ncbi:MAG TPA: hypothetical protein VE033_10590 [Acetobacteraceae bacterium]|nr:hypothetical protein [Acetobacteraceae bacterium]
MNATHGLPRPAPATYTRRDHHDALRPFLLFLGLAFLLRAPAFPAAVIDPDEGLYLLHALTWLGGGWPYVASWDFHPPGAPALLMPAAALPVPALGLRVTGVVAVAATALAIRGLVLVLGGGALTGLAAGTLYIAHGVVLGGLATNAEVLLAPFVASGALILLREARDLRAGVVPGLLPVGLAGLAFGVAIWIRQVAALDAVAVFATLAALGWSTGATGPGRLLLLAGAFAAGCALPMGATVLAYWSQGEVEALLRATLLGPLGLRDASMAGAPGIRAGMAAALPHLTALCLAALLAVLLPGPGRRAGVLLLPWLLGAALAAALPGRFHAHHFLLLLPPLCALGGLGLARTARRVALPEARRALLFGGTLLLALVPVMDMLAPRLGTGMGLREVDPVRRVAAIAADAGETLFVANWHPMVYVLAGRAPPTRYAFHAHLSGVHAPLTGGDQDAELARVLATRPEVIVVAPTRWELTRPEARRVIEAQVARHYERVAQVMDGPGPVEVWRLRR